jgi:hypothetical protein
MKDPFFFFFPPKAQDHCLKTEIEEGKKSK